MAYIQKLGRGNHSKTGHGVPTPFLQVNISGGNDLKAKAQADLEAKMKAAGENKGGSQDVRNFTGTATETIPGKKPTTIVKPGQPGYDKWAAAVKKNPAIENKFKSTTNTETVTGSDIGKDKPKVPTAPAPTPKDFGSWTKESTSIRNAGGGSVTGYTEKSSDLEAGDVKNYIDKYQGKDVTQFANSTSGQNQFQHARVTAQENRIANVYGNTVSPYSDAWSDKKGQAPGSGEAERQKYISSMTSKLDLRDKTFNEKAAAQKTKNEGIVKAGEERKLNILAGRAATTAAAATAAATRAKLLADKGKTVKPTSPLDMRLKDKKKKK